MPRTRRRISVTPKNKPLRKSSSRSSNKSTKLGRVLVDSAQQIARHMRGEIELPMKVVRVVPDVDVRAIREGQGLTREQFAERYGLQARAIQEWEQGRRKTGTGGARLYARHQEPACRGAEGPDSGVAYQRFRFVGEFTPRSLRTTGAG